ncbi:aldo/keto reductase [Blastococcus sp. TBT05-19]|uniref:aldo/keto reductase n=1 Tax=Blastococcus sp. TBT05-19 TaxID=2250581 RepID=UPI000DEB4910|nr:aldo/keto reductase [Blastococcus sp. TBT05-19]RBY89052.1 aldo/keto reductase [Blastococcus sp. TBT05-19]
MQQRRIGDVTVSSIGLGAMPLSTKDPRPADDDAVAVVHAALDAGVTLIDTADAYSRDEAEFGHNESLVARALASAGSPDVLVATKGGHTRRGTDWDLDGSPAYLRAACEASLRRLGVDAIGLYQFHRPDPSTPWEDSMGALRELADDGLVRMVGISNADIAQIDAARAIVGDALVSVQNQFSPGWRSSADELAHCAATGLAFLPWSPFGGVGAAGSLDSTAPAFAEVAEELGVSVYQVTLAWHLAQSDTVVPIPGASRPASIVDSAAAADLRLSPEQLARLDPV